jgi:ABC-type sugar transport system ATPase subunit
VSTTIHTPALRLSGVSKRFANVQALAGVDLEIRPGEVLALVGENGAGKSTLLRILSADYQPDAGGLDLDGAPLTLGAPADAHTAGVRVISQEPEIVPWVSVAENLFVGELPRRAGRRFDRTALMRAARALIAESGFDDVLDARALGVDLSTSQRQLVEILRALKGSARIIAFDEPTSSLTETEAERLFTIIRELRERGLAVVYVSHRLREVLDLADRIAVLRDGRLVQVRDAAGTSEGELMRLMVGRDVSSVFRHGDHRRARPRLEVEGLSTEFLHDVSFSIDAGEVLGVAGLVGAGRSELAKAIFGAAPWTSGRMRVDGAKLHPRHPRDAIRAGVGYAPEDRKSEALVLQRSVAENVSLALLPRIRRFRFVRSRAERRKVAALARRLDIRTPSLDQEIAKLSGGNQQKAVLARWLALGPRVLLLDEPTRGIDVGAKAEIYSLIDELSAEGLAVLFISSELPELLGVSDRILVMRDGRVSGMLARSEANEERIIELAMAGEPDTSGGDA